MHASTFGNAHSVTPWSHHDRVSVAFSAPIARRNVRRGNGKRALPNKRLKVPGGDRRKGNGVLCPRRSTDLVHYSCAGRRVARSLSAIR